MPKEQPKRNVLNDERAIIARGGILHAAAELEMNINIYLAKYFAKDEQRMNEMLSFLFCTSRMSLRNKIELFKNVVIKQHKKEFEDAHPDYADEFKKIMDRRNDFAHLSLDLDYDGSQKTVALGKFKNEKVEVQHYKLETINNIVSLIAGYIDTISNLLK